MQGKEFLEWVWGQQPRGFGFLGWKKSGGWSFKGLATAQAKGLRINNLRDLYFTPNVFREERRQKSLVCASRWLYADLDEVNPESLRWLPTIYWETSHGKYQGMWLLRKGLSPQWHAIINQKLTYLTEADRGGWGASKVLRVPGSISTKHGGDYHILPADYDEGLVYDVREMWAVLRDIPTAVVQSGKINFEETKKAKELMERVPPEARAMLRRRKVRDRSDHVYLTVATLAESGRFSESEVMTLMLTSPVAQEKYGARIRDELERAISKASFVTERVSPRKKKKNGKPKGRPVKKLKTKSLYKFMGQEFVPPSWLVKGIWARGAKGFIAGDPKTYKSTVAVDLAVSVATGKKFLGEFPVMKDARGPVLYVDEENQSGLTQDRFAQVLAHKGLIRPGYLPSQKVKDVHIMSKEQFRLTDESCVDGLQAYVKDYDIKLVILDPLYYVAEGVDESSQDMLGLLVQLDHLATSMGVALLIVHHFRKQNQENPSAAGDFQRMSGTGGFGRWFESILMMERNGSQGIKVHTEHRMARGFGFDLDFEMAGVTDKRYRPVVKVHGSEDREGRRLVEELWEEQDGKVTLPQVCTLLGLASGRVATTRLAKWGYHVRPRGHGVPSVVEKGKPRHT